MNLLGHQKAAYEILVELCSPQTVMNSALTRIILAWYSRFDVFAGLMGGFETVLSREWFSNAQKYLEAQAIAEPTDINWKIEERSASTRLIAMDMSIVFARKSKGEISHEQFLAENETVRIRLREWYEKMDPALKDQRHDVTDFTGAPPPRADDIVDPYQKGVLKQGPIWSMNVCTIAWYSIDLMHRYQTSLTLGVPPGPEMSKIAYAACQLFEAIEYWPGAPKGAIMTCQASLGIATLFLPRDEKHNMWCRRKLAHIESNGYVFMRPEHV